MTYFTALLAFGIIGSAILWAVCSSRRFSGHGKPTALVPFSGIWSIKALHSVTAVPRTALFLNRSENIDISIDKLSTIISLVSSSIITTYSLSQIGYIKHYSHASHKPALRAATVLAYATLICLFMFYHANMFLFCLGAGMPVLFVGFIWPNPDHHTSFRAFMPEVTEPLPVLSIIRPVVTLPAKRSSYLPTGIR